MMIDNPLSAVMRQPHSPIIGEEVLKNSSISVYPGARARTHATQWASVNKKKYTGRCERGVLCTRVFYLQFKLLEENGHSCAAFLIAVCVYHWVVFFSKIDHLLWHHAVSLPNVHPE
jgi:hypothetical protein